jgi:hypothetical protein
MRSRSLREVLFSRSWEKRKTRKDRKVMLSRRIARVHHYCTVAAAALLEKGDACVKDLGRHTIKCTAAPWRPQPDNGWNSEPMTRDYQIHK